MSDPSVTSASEIKIMWDDGISEGGSPIIDYRVDYEDSAG